MDTQGEQTKTALIKGLAVVGFIAILFVGLWGTVQVVKFAPGVLSNLAAVTSFRSVFVPNEEIQINIQNLLVPSNEVFELTWEHNSKPENGTYSFNYVCKEGLAFETPNEAGVNEAIQCDTPFSFSNDTTSLFIIPISETNRFVDAPFSITSVNESGESTTLDDSFLTVVNESVSGGSLGDSDTTTSSSVAGDRIDQVFPISDSRSISDPNGRVDLSVRIIDTGIIDENDNFIPTSTIGVTQQGAVQFSVTNIGSKSSDNWTFNAVLPTMPMHIFHSGGQKVLAPGDRIDFTLGFDQLNRSLAEGTITINADPSGSIHNEINRDNNIAQTTFTISQ